MPSELTKPFSHEVHFYKESEPLPITEHQYRVIREAANTDKFVELNGSLINLSSIESVLKLPEVKPQEKSYRQAGANPIFRQWCLEGQPQPWEKYVEDF